MKMLDTSTEGLKSRAAARAHLADPTRPPNFIVTFVDTLVENGVVVGSIEEEAWEVSLGPEGPTILREKTETFDDFIDRIHGMLPVNGLPTLIVMFPPDDETTPVNAGVSN